MANDQPIRPTLHSQTRSTHPGLPGPNEFLQRYLADLEHNLNSTLEWVASEPDNEVLWARVRTTLTEFLLKEWQTGRLLGSKPEEAFFVRCDRTTMTQNDLENGQLVCLVGIAPVKPAEFVIIRIARSTSDHKA